MKDKLFETTLLFFFTLFISNMLIVSADPAIHSVSPEHGESIDWSPTLIINVSNDEPMDIVWFFNESGEWKIIGTNNSVDSGIYQQRLFNATTEGTTYFWRVNLSDNSSFVNETFSFRRRGWQVIQTIHNISFSAPDSIENLIVFPIEDRGVFKINFEMVFYNYQDSLKIKIPGRLGNKTFYPNEEGIYEISIDIPKDNSILKSPSGRCSIQVIRTDGKSLDFSDYQNTFTYNKWKTNIQGDGSNLNFQIEYVTDMNIIIIIVAILIFPLLLNIISVIKKIQIPFRKELTIATLPAAFFHFFFSGIPKISSEMITLYLFTAAILILYIINLKIVKRENQMIVNKEKLDEFLKYSIIGLIPLIGIFLVPYFVNQLFLSLLASIICVILLIISSFFYLVDFSNGKPKIDWEKVPFLIHTKKSRRR